MHTWKVTTEPTVEPYDMVRAKQYMRIDLDDENENINALLKASRIWVEDYLRRKLISQTITLYRWSFSEAMLLPCPPFLSLTTFKYVNTAGTLTTVDSSFYAIDSTTEPARVRRAYDQSYPSPRWQWDAIQIAYKAGYGTTADTVPEQIKIGIYQMALHLFENREPVIIGSGATKVPMHVEALLRPYRVTEIEP